MRSSRERAADVRPEDIARSRRERAAADPPEPMGRRRRERAAPARPDTVVRSRREHVAAARSAASPALAPSAAPPLAPAPVRAAPIAAPVPWAAIVALALRYDPLQITGGLDRAIALADHVRRDFLMRGGFSVSPRELAACLAFECRSMQHCGMEPQGDDLSYLTALFAVVEAERP